MGITKPCLNCGEDIEHGARCARCAIPRKQPNKSRRTGYTAAWERLSKRIRKDSPFCEQCGNTTDLTVDHIIPISETPELHLERLNLRVLCRSCNSTRSNNCTAEERNAVYAAIAARKTRQAKQLKDDTPRQQHSMQSLLNSDK